MDRPMKKLTVLLLIAMLFGSTSCATLLFGTRATVTLDSKDTDSATIIADGVTYEDMVFPARVQVKRGYSSSTIEARNGGLKGSVLVEKKIAPLHVLVGLLMGGMIVIDGISGALMEPTQDKYMVKMKPSWVTSDTAIDSKSPAAAAGETPQGPTM